ncbi:MAG: ABC transporter ATP-binding protein [Turicibacter sp.]|nr:ABC transporter ATP-binding protein [Turicibacter sp.]
MKQSKQPFNSKENIDLSRGKKKDSKTFKRLLTYLFKHKLKFTFVLACIIISALTGVASSLFLQVLIDDYITPLLLEAVPDFSGLFRVVLLMAGLYLIGVLATLFYNRLMAVISQQVLKEIRDEMFAHMQTLPIKYFDTHTHGDLMSHYTNDTDTLRQMLSQSIPQLISSAMTVIAVFCSMLTLSFWLTAIVIIFLIIALKIIKTVAGKSGQFFMAQQKSLGEVNGYIEEMIHGQKVVKVFCYEEKSKEKFNELNEQLCLNSTEANKYVNILMPIMNNLGYLLYVVLTLFGGIMAIAGTTNFSIFGTGVISLGMIASFLQLSRNFINPIAQISQQINSIVMALAGAERIFNLMDQESEKDHGEVHLVNVMSVEGKLVESKDYTGHWAWKRDHGHGKIDYIELQGDIQFNQVDFEYEPNKRILHNINLYAKPGQKVAFVGSTGAGKTTITNLINRFYDIANGEITYDGIPIDQINKQDLRRSLGIVLQDVNLFTGTVLENIRYGKLDATDEECIEAAKLANAHHFIEMLPQGYHTVLSGDGSGLSQGQRQLISIARAAVANPPVMILDEATSSIDTRTEAIVQRGMDSLMHGRTVFVIAHRLSTVQNADVIIVLEHGRIIERGNHETLIEKRGKYYQLYTGAFELE